MPSVVWPVLSIRNSEADEGGYPLPPVLEFLVTGGASSFSSTFRDTVCAVGSSARPSLRSVLFPVLSFGDYESSTWVTLLITFLPPILTFFSAGRASSFFSAININVYMEWSIAQLGTLFVASPLLSTKDSETAVKVTFLLSVLNSLAAGGA